MDIPRRRPPPNERANPQDVAAPLLKISSDAKIFPRQPRAGSSFASLALAAKTETADKKDNFSRKQPSFRHLTYTTAPNISIFFTSYKFLQALKYFWFLFYTNLTA